MNANWKKIQQSIEVQEVQVLVTLQVLPCEKDKIISEIEAENGAVEAVRNALKKEEDNGFNHKYVDKLSIQVVEVEKRNEQRD